MNKNALIASLFLSLYGGVVGYFLGATTYQSLVSFGGFFVAALFSTLASKRLFEFPLEILLMVILLPLGFILDYSHLMIFNILLIIAIQVIARYFVSKKAPITS